MGDPLSLRCFQPTHLMTRPLIGACVSCQGAPCHSAISPKNRTWNLLLLIHSEVHFVQIMFRICSSPRRAIALIETPLSCKSELL